MAKPFQKGALISQESKPNSIPLHSISNKHLTISSRFESALNYRALDREQSSPMHVENA
jgi:hypothetical protein